VQIVGVSFDSPADNQAWAEDEGFQYELWTDESRALALHYGAAFSDTQPYALRVTVLLDANGDLLLEYNVGADISTHPGRVLEDIETLRAAGAL
jgi:peroxiredoxin Q/BCP